MTNANDVRKAHELLDELDARAELSQEQEKLLRSFLPELPKQKTLAKIIAHVDDAWSVASGNDWGGNSYNPNISIEDWLTDLHEQLKGLIDTPAAEPANPTHPEFLEIEADYRNAPFGTIVVGKNYYPWTKTQSSWLAYGAQSRNDFEMRACRRYVLRWGDK